MKISDNDFERVVEHIKNNYGIDLSKKKLLIEGRLSFPVSNGGFAGFSEYLDSVLANENSAEYTNFLSRLTTNHTYFMRETNHYVFFTQQFLSEVKNKERGNDIRIWSAGCSFGHEPYNMAMYIDQYFGNIKYLWDLKILATDISHKALLGAKKGIYFKEDLADVPENWIKQYFSKIDNESYQISTEIRNQVVFKYLNLMEEFTIKKPFDVIFCRNVMIYFDAVTRERLVNKFVDVLKTGGYLFVGHSETLPKNDRIVQVRPSIFKKL